MRTRTCVRSARARGSLSRQSPDRRPDTRQGHRGHKPSQHATPSTHLVSPHKANRRRSRVDDRADQPRETRADLVVSWAVDEHEIVPNESRFQNTEHWPPREMVVLKPLPAGRQTRPIRRVERVRSISQDRPGGSWKGEVFERWTVYRTRTRALFVDLPINWPGGRSSRPKRRSAHAALAAETPRRHLRFRVGAVMRLRPASAGSRMIPL